VLFNDLHRINFGKEESFVAGSADCSVSPIYTQFRWQSLDFDTSNAEFCFQRRLEGLIMSEPDLLASSGCARMHLLAWSSYIENWRWYLKALSDEFEEIVKIPRRLSLKNTNIIQADLALTFEFSGPKDYKDGYKTLTQLQYLQERIFPLTARFDSSYAVTSQLLELVQTFEREEYHNEELCVAFTNNLRQFGSKYQGHTTSAKTLASRVRGLIKLVSFLMNSLELLVMLIYLGIAFCDSEPQKPSNISGYQAQYALLTKDTVDDSATVRVVTLVTLIYLPASFISVSYQKLPTRTFC
jgi:hypothetical protein